MSISKSSCTQSLKSVSCGVELSPFRDHTNIKDTNRISIPFLVHAIVEIRVLRSRAVSASRSHQFQGYKPCQYPKSSCTQSMKSVSCGVELSPYQTISFRGPNRVNIPGSGTRTKRKAQTALRGTSSPAAAFWPMSGPSQKQRESHERSLTSCSGQVCTR